MMTDEELKELLFDYNRAVRRGLIDMIECDCGGLLYARVDERPTLNCLACKAKHYPGVRLVEELTQRCGRG